MSEWQPFETAPKTGEFLVYMPGEQREFQVMYRTERYAVVGGAFLFDLSEKPTLWAPIPPLTSGKR
jgi:hypothetical protein